MKKINIKCLVITLILFQSCVVYQTNSVSLSQALDKGEVKIIAKSNKVYMFKTIELTDSTYYGVVRYYKNPETKNIEAFTVMLDSSSISNIYLKDIKKSKIKTFIGAGIPMAFAVGIGVYILFLAIFYHV